MFLVGTTVFKTDERRFAALAGSIPVRLRSWLMRDTVGPAVPGPTGVTSP